MQCAIFFYNILFVVLMTFIRNANKDAIGCDLIISLARTLPCTFISKTLYLLFGVTRELRITQNLNIKTNKIIIKFHSI